MKKINRYKVTRTWYVDAYDTAEAISKSKQILHTEVEAKKLKEKRITENEHVRI